jgi:hypothetical protein
MAFVFTDNNNERILFDFPIKQAEGAADHGAMDHGAGPEASNGVVD